jgi:hypothetical protein
MSATIISNKNFLMLQRVEQMRKYFRQKLGEVPVFVKIVMFDDEDFDITVVHTNENHIQHRLFYHDESQLVDYHLWDVSRGVDKEVMLAEGSIPVTVEEIFCDT